MEKRTPDNKMQRPDLENKDQQGKPLSPAKIADARRAYHSPHFGANYGPSASYTPATDK